MKRLSFTWWVALLALGPAGIAMAQSGVDYRVRAYIQPDQDITEQQSIRLVIEAEGQGSPQLSVNGLRNLKNLQVIAGPERVFNSMWANGQLSSRTSLVYTLVPHRPVRSPLKNPWSALEIHSLQTWHL